MGYGFYGFSCFTSRKMSAINFEQSGKRREKRAGTSGKGAKGEGSYDPTEKGWNP